MPLARPLLGRQKTGVRPGARSLAESPGDVVLGVLLFRFREEVRRLPVLDQPPQPEEGVMSDTRAACWRLCVTMTIVVTSPSSGRSTPRSSASRSGRAPSRARHEDDVGSLAMARAMQSRCICRPTGRSPFSSRRSLTSSHSAALRRCAHRPRRAWPCPLMPAMRRRTPRSRRSTGKRFDFWKTMPTLRRTSMTSVFAP